MTSVIIPGLIFTPYFGRMSLEPMCYGNDGDIRLQRQMKTAFLERVVEFSISGSGSLGKDDDKRRNHYEEVQVRTKCCDQCPIHCRFLQNIYKTVKG
jgi:hypothetical protein